MSTSQIVLLGAPPILLGSTWVVFRQGASRWGQTRGYFAGFVFYWIVWCLTLPLVLLGADGVVGLFGHPPTRMTESNIFLLVLPLVLGYGYAFPKAVRDADAKVIAISAVLALFNGTFEELLWRGAYLRVFPDNLFDYVYPSIGFAVWHFAPQSVIRSRTPGGAASFVAVPGLLGLIWGWVARMTGSLLWSTASHVLFDFSGLGARVYFAPPKSPAG